MTCAGCMRIEEAQVEVDGVVVCDQCVPEGCEMSWRNLPQCIGGQCRSPASCQRGERKGETSDE